MRLIDADHLKSWILSRVFKTQLNLADVIDQIDREDTIEPGRKTGEWNFIGDNMFECTCCGIAYTAQQFDSLKNHTNDKRFPRFCPNCGEKMEGNG